MTEEVRDDLKLCSEFLTTAHAGILMNLIVFRKPSHEYVSVGGYSLTSGKAWCFQLPVDCQHRVSLNSLEFVAALITLWVDVLDDVLPPEPCLLSLTDSSSVAGWLHKSNFDPNNQSFQMHIACKLA